MEMKRRLGNIKQLTLGIASESVEVMAYLVFVLSVFCGSAVYAGQMPESIDLDLVSFGSEPSNLSFYTNKDGEVELIYQKSHETSPGEMYWSQRQGSEWTNPTILNLLNENEFALEGVGNLNNDSAMMLIKGDDTDYGKVFGLSAPPPAPLNDETPVLSMISDDDLEKLLRDNQRLYYSIKSGSEWSTPIVIPSTYKAMNATLVTDNNGGAIIVYALDMDGDAATLADIELFFINYKNNSWSPPVRLTNNILFDYGFKLVHLNGKYLIVWVSDEDGDFNTIDDSRLYYSEIDSSGSVVKQATTISTSANNTAAFVLGVNSEEMLLLWPDKQTDGSVQLVEVHYETVTGWLPQTQTLFSEQGLYQSDLLWLNNRWLLINQVDNVISFYMYVSNSWQTIDSMTSIEEDDMQLSEIEFYEKDNNLLIAYSGRKQMANEGLNLSQGEGLYVADYMLSYDMAVGRISYSPEVLREGQSATLKIQVENKGLVDSPNCVVEVWKDNALMGVTNAMFLAPGESGELDYAISVQGVESDLRFVITGNVDDVDSGNDTKSYNLKVKPDFTVKSIKKTGATQISVDVREIKGVASPSVNVVAYLTVNDVETLVATGSYSSNSVDPVVFDIPALAGLIDDHKIIVEINSDKKTDEDSYENNSLVYEYSTTLSPDFTVLNLSVTDSEIQITLINSGAQFSGNVDLLLTDDPMQANKTSLITNPWYFQQLELNPAGVTTLTLPKSNLPVITGQYLYAVVNPYGVVKELDRNNNVIKKLVAALSASQPPAAVSLVYNNQGYMCGNLDFTIKNNSADLAYYLKLSLANIQGIVISSTQIPVLASLTEDNISLHDIQPGLYSLKVTQRIDSGDVVAIDQSLDLSVDNCASAGNELDFSVSGLTYLGPVLNDIDKFDFAINLLIAGYAVDYTKPLIRVPLNIEVKQGTTLISSMQRIVYISNISSLNNVGFQLSQVELPSSGGYSLIVSVPQRTGEVATANNIAVINVN